MNESLDQKPSGSLMMSWQRNHASDAPLVAAHQAAGRPVLHLSDQLKDEHEDGEAISRPTSRPSSISQKVSLPVRG